MRLLQRIASALAATLTTEDVSKAVLGLVGDAVSAVSSTIWLVDREREHLSLAEARGSEDDALRPFVKMPLTSDLPGPVAVNTEEPIFVTSQADRDARWPALAGIPTKSEALAVIPLRVPNRVMGVLAFGFPDVRSFDADDRLTLVAIADQCAAALDRARMHDQLRAEMARQEVIARVTATLAGNLDPSAVIDEVTSRCVPDLADICCVYVREGDLVARIAISTTFEAASELANRYPLPLSAPLPVCEAIRTGTTQHFGKLDPKSVAAGSPDPAYAEIVTNLPLNDGIVVPMFDNGRAFGAMTFVFATPGRTYEDGFVPMVAAVADKTAAALSGARRFVHQHAAVQALHEVALPTSPPTIDGLDMAAVYVPFTADTGLGGDWWDAFALRGDHVGFGIGDVAGHGVNSAAVMGQLRNALRAFMIRGSETSETLDALSELLAWEHRNTFATAVVAKYHVHSCTLEWSSAGHPPPLLLHPDGRTEYLPTTSRPPIGVADRASDVRRDKPARHVRQIEPGSVLYFFTDGLFESKDEDLDAGMARLASAVGTVPVSPRENLQGHSEQVVAAMIDEVADDVCLLTVRIATDRAPAAESSDAQNDMARHEIRFPSALESAAKARGWLEPLIERSVDEGVLDEAKLVLTELVNNAVVHARGSELAIELTVTPDALELAVCDEGSGRPSIVRNADPSTPGGRGLLIIDRLCEAWGTTGHALGKRVWARIPRG